jgi:DNA-directed RNA polymerase specialized sigma subunit
MATTTRRRTRRPPATAADQSKLGTFPPPTDISEDLAVANLRLASDRARKFAAKAKMDGIVADLEAVAWTGLLNACRRYRPDRVNPATGKPYAISTVAVPFIDGAMRRYLRDKGHPIKFPNEWREKAPRARRELLSGKRTLEEAAEIVGMDPLDLGEMIHSMGPTGEIQDDQFQSRGPEADMPDEEGQSALAAELQLAETALAKLGDDRLLLEEWWNNPKRRGVPGGPLQQFQRRARAIRAKDALPEIYQQGRLEALPEN